jgi:amino acid transporter
MNTMVGMGPFITIPIILSAMGGPQAMLGWIVGAVIVMFDSMVWCELAAALPNSGGSYHFLRSTFSKIGLGRLVAFLFIWQYLISGPLEIASGYIGLSPYAQYLHTMTSPETQFFGRFVGFYKLIGVSLQPADVEAKFLGAFVGLLILFLAYRSLKSLGKFSVVLWVGTLVTVLGVIISGLPRFDPHLAFNFPPHAFDLNGHFIFTLGVASGVAIYDYLGYYEVCYLGEEVKEPAKTLPKSILVSVTTVAIIYFLIYMSVIGVMPWDKAAASNVVVADLMEMLYGHKVAVCFTVLIIWTGIGSIFSLLLGYSRIPYAAALDGNFFKMFARLHPKGNFPYLSLLLIGVIASAGAFLPLDGVIDALLATRILGQFVMQIFAVVLLQKTFPEKQRPFKMWFYPLPSVIAFVGWIYIFITATKTNLDKFNPWFTWSALMWLPLGIFVFYVWSKFKPASRNKRIKW